MADFVKEHGIRALTYKLNYADINITGAFLECNNSGAMNITHRQYTLALT